MVASVGRSVIRKRMFLYSISEGAGLMLLLDLMFALFALITLVQTYVGSSSIHCFADEGFYLVGAWKYFCLR